MKFVFDIDGTICFKGKPVSKPLLIALENLTKQGHEVIFASARPIRDLLPVLHQRFHTYSMIGGNGSIISSQGNILSTVSFEEKTQEAMIALLQKYHVSYLIDSDWDYAYTGPAAHPILNNLDPQRLAKKVELGQLTSIVKMLLLTSDHMEEVEKELRKMEVVVHVHGDEGVLDISPQGIDKWTGLQQLGVAAGDYLAFGNDANDITMFQHAMYTVMIGDNPQLLPFASETLPLSERIEYDIAQRLEQLSKQYSSENDQDIH
ncbi:HAD-IIB family hydrolase [Gracilibacillus timonensis]|uniref:HAD-IIB family hydrolase n=1 Tax=Gracilibacillus timonensis TaxID=1816696 RepID=UPI0008256776|nr:HAD family hydrolase [Gracilibacillus timonensis]